MTNPYHLHLDACARCRARPWDLCATGLDALRAAASAGPPEARASGYDRDREPAVYAAFVAGVRTERRRAAEEQS